MVAERGAVAGDGRARISVSSDSSSPKHPLSRDLPRPFVVTHRHFLIESDH